MSYPIQVARTYVNPSGNLAASGYYRSSMDQELANMMPPWMHLRQNPISVGQQFLSVPAVQLKRLETDINDSIRDKFITTAKLDEVDVIYRAKLPSNVDLTDASASGVRCIAAPSGCSPSGVSQIYLTEVSNLEEFYYNVLPTRLEVLSSGVYTSTIDGVAWNTKPSGILDLEEKHIDVWGKTHDISWCYANSYIRKQDVETMEDYEMYEKGGSYDLPFNGYPTDMAYYKGILWCLGMIDLGYAGKLHWLSLNSTKTQRPNKKNLDLLAYFYLGSTFQGSDPSGFMIGEDGRMWICDTKKMSQWEVAPRYDYFILDADNRYVYLKEDYTDSGVFISNT